MKNLLKIKKFILIIVAAFAFVTFFLILNSRRETLPLQLTENKKVQLEKGVTEVLATKDKDGYGLQILARGFKNVKSVEMLVSYNYRGKENPPLLASGAPQQNSYWAHFRFESCSRGDCLYYKINEAKFQLTLTYEDGTSFDSSSVINISKVSTDTSINL